MVMGGALAAAACSPIASPQASSSASGAPAGTAAGATGSATPKKGGTLHYGRITDINSPNGLKTGQTDWIGLTQFYDTLTVYDPSLTPHPALAESWDFSTDAKRLKVSLRKGVHYHSGKEFTANDVKYTALLVRDPKIGSQLADPSKWITDMQIPDKYTIIFTFDKPRPSIFDLLNDMWIVDQQTIEGAKGATAENGTGPFKLVEWVPGNRIRMTRNPDYWDPGRPYLDEVDVVVIKDPQALLVQLESGAVSVAERVPERDAARYQKTSGYSVYLNKHGSDVYYVGANCRNHPFDDKRVRQAINYALDRERFLKDVLSGIGEASDLAWPEGSPAYEASKIKKYDHDLDKAKSLFQQAGATDIPLYLISNAGQPPLADQAQQLQADLAKIGVKLNVQTLQIPEWRDQFFKGSWKGLISGPFGPSNEHPLATFTTSAPFIPGKSTTGFTSDQYAKLVAELEVAADVAKQKQLYSELNDLMLDESFVMPMIHQQPNIVMKSNVHDISQQLNGGILLRDAWIG